MRGIGLGSSTAWRPERPTTSSSPGPNLLNPGPAVRWTSGFDRTYLVLDIDRDRTTSGIWGFFDFGKYLPWNPGEILLAALTSWAGADSLT